MGDPAVLLETLLDCGCDACDSGSRDLLEVLDETVLSVVDGSLEVSYTPHGHTQRTSFSSQAGSSIDQPPLSLHLTAGPWAASWVPRELNPPIL